MPAWIVGRKRRPRLRFGNLLGSPLGLRRINLHLGFARVAEWQTLGT